MRHGYIFLLSLALGASVGCTRKADKSQLTITFPKTAVFTPSASTKVSSLSTGDDDGPPWDTTVVPSGLNEINCYGVLVGGPTPDLSYNSTYNETGVLKHTFGPWRAGVPQGQTIQLEVSSGPGRKIVLIGFKATAAGSCYDFHTTDPPDVGLSQPYVLAELVRDLNPGDVSLTITPVFNSSKKLWEFKGPDFNDYQNGTMGPLFGDGRDGDLTVAAPVSSAVSALSYNHGSMSYTPATGGPTSTKIFSAAKRVTEINNTDRSKIELATPSLAVSTFEPGDEILWMVMAGHHPTLSPDPNACGADLFLGSWGFAKITNILGDLAGDVGNDTNIWIQLDKPITTNAAPVQNTNLAQTTLDGTLPFCRIQIVRVPNFNSLTVNSVFSISPDPFSMTNGYGGIVAFRTKSLSISTSVNINASALGFQAVANNQGGGVSGVGIDSPMQANSNGGAGGSTTPYEGGGGANAGAGGASTGGAPGGNPMTYCIGNSPCGLVRDRKGFLGGAGGSSAGLIGANGGGLIFIHAEHIFGPGSLTLNADGGVAVNNATGGGGGGTVHLSVKQLNLTGSISLQANGGTGMTTGGGGGGGSLEVPLCESQSTISAALLSSYANVNGNGIGSPTSGVKLIHHEPGLCQ